MVDQFECVLGVLSCSMFHRPLPPVLTDDGTSLTVVAAIPELDVWLWRTTVWLVSVAWSVTRSLVSDKRVLNEHENSGNQYHTLLFTFYMHWRLASFTLLITSVLWRHHRRFRGHAHPVPIRHRFSQLPAANHRAVASRLQPCAIVILCSFSDTRLQKMS